MHIIFIYLGIFVGIFFEGEMVMVSAVIAAHHQYVNLWSVVVIGFFSTYAADVFYFLLGRKRGKAWLLKNEHIHKKAQHIQEKIARYPVIIFILYRFLYGLRTITPIVIGTSSIKTQTFLWYSALSTLLWTSVVTAAGFGFSTVIESKLSYIEHIEKYIIGGLVLVGGVLYWIYHFRKDKTE